MSLKGTVSFFLGREIFLEQLYPVSPSDRSVVHVLISGWDLDFISSSFKTKLGWSSGKEFTCQCRRHGCDLWSGKISHASGQLSLCAETPEPTLESMCIAAREATAMRSPHTTARE